MSVWIINIKYKFSNQSFNVYLNRTGWWSFEGEWSCLPGYLKTDKGFFEYRSFIGFDNYYLWFTDKYDDESYLSLNKFSPDLGVGDSGAGSIYALGVKGKKMMCFYDMEKNPQYLSPGAFDDRIIWKIKEIC